MSYPPPPGAGAPGGFPPPGGGYPPPGGYQGGFAPPQAQQTNGLAIAALITGIVSILGCVIAPVGLIAIVLGVVALGKAKQLNGSGKGLAIGGIVTGTVGLISGVVFVFIFFIAADAADDAFDDVYCRGQRLTLETSVAAYQASGQGDPSSQQDLIDAGVLSSEIQEYDFSISNGTVTTTAVDGEGCD